jgi:glutamine synthetase
MSTLPRGILSTDHLKELVANGDVDTVINAICDMQGRLMGKRDSQQRHLPGAHRDAHADGVASEGRGGEASPAQSPAERPLRTSGGYRQLRAVPGVG